MGSLWRRTGNWWEEYLGRLSRAGRESFGTGRMDCCGLGRASEARKHG